MLKRYLFGLFLGLAVLAGIIFWCGGFFIGYLDFPSLVLIVFLPFAVAFMSHGPSAMGSPTRPAFAEDKAGIAELKRAKACVQALGRYAIASGVVGFFLGVIATFQNVSNPNVIGAHLAVTLVSSLYATLFVLFLTQPLSSRLEDKIIEREHA